jgi:dTMP kinase
MRVLIDGLDLSGKTTLTAALAAELQARGRTVTVHRGFLADRHPARRLLKKLPLVRQPDSTLVTTAYLSAGYVLDSLLVRTRACEPAGTVLIQDGYVDRTVAFGMAGGPYLAAVLALRWPRVFAPFDVAVYLHAPADARRARLGVRETPDAVDICGVEDAEFAATFTAMLTRGMGRRHKKLLVFDTSAHSPHEMATAIADALLGTSVAPAAPTAVAALGELERAA